MEPVPLVAYSNTKLYLTAWRQLFAAGDVFEHEWIIKVDPDTVFFAGRLKAWLPPASAAPLLVANCEVPMGADLPPRPMMLGSLEIINVAAGRALKTGMHDCEKSAPLNQGEARFLNECAEQSGWDLWADAAHTADGIVIDAACANSYKPGCTHDSVSFHPFKKVADFQACHEQAKNVSRAKAKGKEPNWFDDSVPEKVVWGLPDDAAGRMTPPPGQKQQQQQQAQQQQASCGLGISIADCQAGWGGNTVPASPPSSSPDAGGDGADGKGSGGQNIWGSTPAAGSCHSTQPNDVKVAKCAGWCAADKAAEHCGLCECRGCQRLTAACADDAALSAASDALAKISAPSSPPPWAPSSHVKVPVQATAPTGECFSTHEGDVSQAICSGWCEVAKAADHCSWCKCRGCQRLADACSLTETESGRSIMERMSAPQQAQQQQQHVSMPMAAAPVAQTGPCNSSQPDDISVADCAGWCRVEEAEMHCRWCRCRGCERLAGACAFFSSAAASSMLPSSPLSQISEAEVKKLSITKPPEQEPVLKANGDPEPRRKCVDGDTGKPVYCSEEGARPAAAGCVGPNCLGEEAKPCTGACAEEAKGEEAVAEAAAVAEAEAVADADAESTSEAAAAAAANAGMRAEAEAGAVDPPTPREANAAVVSPLHEAAAGGEAAVMRCVRETFADMHSWYEHIPRRAKDHDCEYMCFSDRKDWCAAYEFGDEGNGTCKMFDDCSAWTPGTSLARRPTGTGEAAAAREAAAVWDREAAAAARGRGDWLRRPRR